MAAPSPLGFIHLDEFKSILMSSAVKSAIAGVGIAVLTTAIPVLSASFASAPIIGALVTALGTSLLDIFKTMKTG